MKISYQKFFFQKVPDMPLAEEQIAECLSLLCKTGDGLAHAYVRLDVHDRLVYMLMSGNVYV